MPDYQAKLAAFLALPDEDLSRPLWEIAPADRKAFLAARTRRQFSGRPIGDEFQMPEAHQRVTDWAETE
ncbi:hypothetical protein [Streptomyces pseudogriseolus]|uniref:hypothetical protein n=1 Tax=Streptomyces pseudogriseolus TaxID=36817 RepID=UPI00346A46BE